jgi:hypothetical protein
MWSLIRDPHFGRRRDERHRPSREGRLRGPLLEVGDLLGGDWLEAPHSSSTAE